MLGAAAFGVVKGIDEGYFVTHPTYGRKFPYEETINPLPPVDDWIILGAAALITGVGHAIKNDKVRNFGAGGLLFQGANVIRIIVIRGLAMSKGIQLGRVPLRYTVPIRPIKQI